MKICALIKDNLLVPQFFSQNLGSSGYQQLSKVQLNYISLHYIVEKPFNSVTLRDPDYKLTFSKKVRNKASQFGYVLVFYFMGFQAKICYYHNKAIVFFVVFVLKCTIRVLALTTPAKNIVSWVIKGCGPV